MKLFKFLIVGLLLVNLSCEKPTLVKTGVIPQPTSIKYKEGRFQVNNNTVIKVDNSKEGQKMASDLVSFFKHNFELDLAVKSKASKNAIKLVLTENEGDNVDGAYKLNISNEGIVIESKSYRGVFYGIQTLKQLLTPKNTINKPILSYVSINDAPEFQWRGMMLDVSRHFFSKDSVKKVIDVMAMHKLNKFHWHLVDGIGWRIQIDKYPELTNKGAWRKVKANKKPWTNFEVSDKKEKGKYYGGFYTKNDIKEIIAYASERYIDVIPEIEMPGHSEAALQCYPELTCVGTTDSGVYCAGNDKSFEFLQNILAEVIELFPNQYLHIGGDEVSKENWLQCKKCKNRMKEENLHDGEELQSYFVKRMEAFIHSKNRKLIGWDEILEGGLPERATVMSWRGVKGGIEAANAGHDVVMSPGSPCYFDHSQGKSEFEPPSWGGHNNLLKVYAFNPVPDSISVDKRHHILGGQANLWTEQISNLSHLQYMMLPRLCALSEALWTNPDMKNENIFIKKMDFHFDRLTDLGYNFAGSSLSPDYLVEFNEESKKYNLTLSNELNLYEIRYSLDGSKPTMNSALYNQTIEFKNPINLNAQCFRNGEPIGFPLKKMFSTNFGENTKVNYVNPFADSYSGGGEKALFNNKFAVGRGDDPNWQGFQKKDFSATIKLDKQTEIEYIGFNFFQHIGATSVMLPTNVTIAISEDGINFKSILDLSIETSKNPNPIIKRVEAEFNKQPVAFIKIVAKNRGVLPEWHIRKGDAWVFLDEVSVK